MSGFYNNWYKVNHPDSSNNIVPMESGGYQVPFFFGGSQIPINLGIDNTISGCGYSKTSFKPELRGKGIQSTKYNKTSNIQIPRQIGSLNRSM